MKKKRSLLATCILSPLALAYGSAVKVRNKMFDCGLLKQREFDIPVVVVGNISVGGTGKTPHTEYIINDLRYRYKTGVLSRGYGRKTRGFVVADRYVTPHDVGDEPYQVYRKYGKDVMVAVCEDRCEGIDNMRKINPAMNLVVLDDAFQHRYVKPTVSVVLTEYSRPAFHDNMLPLGRLRESTFALNRADIVVVTKCPRDMTPMDYRIFIKNLNLFPYQKLFFSTFSYGKLVPVFPDDVTYIPYPEWLGEDESVLAVAGIANPVPFVKHLRGFKAKVKHIIFPDHHDFDRKDIAAIVAKYEAMKGKQKYIITTEKDAVRLAGNPDFPRELRARTFYQPIKVEFLSYQDQGPSFDETLLKMIEEKKAGMSHKA